MFDVHAIATVKCPINQMSQGNWATVDSEIHLDPEYAAGLQGLEGFSHVLVIFFLDRAQGFDRKTQLLRRPRGMEDMHEVGVFAQRTKYRPNPIGVTAVKLLGIDGNVVRVRGLDALDGRVSRFHQGGDRSVGPGDQGVGSSGRVILEETTPYHHTSPK
jgi:tRNA-Thr(GGU) m(6)t(6)A37 methyltransferase TsaA